MVQTTVRAYVYMAPRWALGSQNATWSDAEQRITQAGMRPRDAVRVIESARAAFPRLELLEAVAQLLADHPALQVTESFVVRQAKKARPEEAKVWRREEARQLEEQKREEARVFEESGGAAGLRARLGEYPITPPTAAEVARQRAEEEREQKERMEKQQRRKQQQAEKQEKQAEKQAEKQEQQQKRKQQQAEKQEKHRLVVLAGQDAVSTEVVPAAEAAAAAAEAAATTVVVLPPSSGKISLGKISLAHRSDSRLSVARQRRTPPGSRPLPPLVWLGRRYRFETVIHYIPASAVALPAAEVWKGGVNPSELVAVLTGPEAAALFEPLREDSDRRLRDADLVLHPEYTKRGAHMRAAMGAKPFGLPLSAAALAGLARCTPMATAVPWSSGSATNIRTPLALVCTEHLDHHAHSSTTRRMSDTTHTVAVRRMLHGLGLHPGQAAMSAAQLTPPVAEERTLFFLSGGRRALHSLYQDPDYVYVAPRDEAILLSPHRDSAQAVVALKSGHGLTNVQLNGPHQAMAVPPPPPAFHTQQGWGAASRLQPQSRREWASSSGHRARMAGRRLRMCASTCHPRSCRRLGSAHYRRCVFAQCRARHRTPSSSRLSSAISLSMCCQERRTSSSYTTSCRRRHSGCGMRPRSVASGYE